jgi:hypothetical protein
LNRLAFLTAVALAIAGAGVVLYVRTQSSAPTNVPKAPPTRGVAKVDSSTTARVGETAPELARVERWTNTGGRALTLADLRGKVVLLEFWAVW